MRDTYAVALPEHDQPCALQLFTPPAEQTRSSRLPVLTSASDIREFVRYLKRQPSGVVPAEELDRSRRRLFEERKLSAYRNLGITEEHGGSLILSPFGRALAARLEPETQAFRRLLTGNRLYIAAAEWIYERNLEVVTTTDLVAFWLSLDSEIDEFHKPDWSKGAAISFFSFCEAAELGTLTLGKRGHTTRLNIDRQELATFVQTRSERGLSTLCDYRKDSTEDRRSVSAVSGREPNLRVLVVNSGNTVLADLETLELIITIQASRRGVSAADLEQPNPCDVIDIT